MTTPRKLIIVSCIATLTASLAIAEVAEAGPVGPGMNAPTELDPVDQTQTQGKPKKNVGRGGNAASRLVIAPGAKAPAGVLAPAPDHTVALAKRKSPIPAHLDPGQIMKMSVGGGTEIADGIAAGIIVTGMLSSGTLFGNSIDVRAHPAGASSENTLQIALLPENGTQTYEYEIEVGKGLFNVAVDAYWNDTSLGPPRDRDELMGVGKQRSHEGKLYVTLAPDPSWTVVPTAYYVIVSRDDADWTFRGVTIARGI